jgi:hypothetical protein
MSKSPAPDRSMPHVYEGPHQYTPEEEAQVERLRHAGIERSHIAHYFDNNLGEEFLGPAIGHLVETEGMGRLEAARVIWKEVLQHALSNPDDKTDIKLNNWELIRFNEITLGTRGVARVIEPTPVKPRQHSRR